MKNILGIIDWSDDLMKPLSYILYAWHFFRIMGHYTWLHSLLEIMFHNQKCVLIWELTHLINIFWVLIPSLYIITYYIFYKNYTITTN